MATSRTPEPALLGERLEALPGISRLREAARGAPAYLVGGAVRDLLIGRAHPDLDVVVEGDAAQAGAIARELGGELREHERFATATVRDRDLHVDLAASRAESYARPGALPDVRPAPLAEDLARRDFSINAMAVPLEGEPDLIDPYSGLEDLRAGELRVLHSGSFADDPTRALRAARYAARLDLKLEQRTAALLRDADLATVSEDRVETELRRTAAEPGAAIALDLVAEWGLVHLHEGAPALVALLDALLAEPPWDAVVNRTEAIMLVVHGRETGARHLAQAQTPASASEGRRAADNHSLEELAIARALGADWLDRYLTEWRQVQLEIDGADLVEAGVPEGPAVGRGLEASLAAKLDGEVSGREAELERAIEAAKGE